jgi:hypothetical protein
MKNITKILAAGSVALPFMAFAQNANNANFGWINSLIQQVGTVITNLIPLLIAIALLVFIWGVVKFISAADDSARDDGKKKMIWGIVGLFVIISVWGLVALLRQLVGVGTGSSPTNLPTVNLNTTV